MTDGICPTNGCGNDEPAIVRYTDDLWCVSCKKCGGYMTFYICPEEDAYVHGIELWIGITREMNKADRSRGRSSDDD